jgi:hypothetical protein
MAITLVRDGQATVLSLEDTIRLLDSKPELLKNQAIRRRKQKAKIAAAHSQSKFPVSGPVQLVVQFINHRSDCIFFTCRTTCRIKYTIDSISIQLG